MLDCVASSGPHSVRFLISQWPIRRTFLRRSKKIAVGVAISLQHRLGAAAISSHESMNCSEAKLAFSFQLWRNFGEGLWESKPLPDLVRCLPSLSQNVNGLGVQRFPQLSHLVSGFGQSPCHSSVRMRTQSSEADD
jgi:hypothetical protein